MELHEMLERVDGPEPFLEFVRALCADREAEVGQPIDLSGRGANGWENHTIEDFLNAALAWGESTNMGETQDMAHESPWKRCADFLWCGKIYE